MDVTAERSFAELLREARRQAQLTQQQLAAQAGISVRAVSDLERGINRAPRATTLAQLADALDLSADERCDWAAVCARGSPNSTSPDAAATGARPLPRPFTSFIGRDDEIRSVSELLEQTDVRLVTLTGPGGVGKTRLALAIAERASAAFPDGVRIVSLAPLSDPALVIPTVAQTLGVHVVGIESPLDPLATWLRHRTVLIVLDNVEHLLPAAPEIAALLDGSPGLTILATSRAPLHISAEREIQVPPLAVPAFDRKIHAADLEGASAIRLFVDRAQAVRSDFLLTDENAATIAAICTRLDGLPLAIELAAARLRLLSPSDLLARLADSLPLLVDGPRDVPARQQTLIDTIAWSYNLLTEPEQRLFRQLTIFAGGWTLEAAEAVCDPDLNVLDGMSTLVDHNLVRQSVQRGDASRYTMLETIRQFGRRRLEEHDELGVLAGRYVTYFTDEVERINTGINGPDQAIWVERLVPEIDNVRHALAIALERNDGLAALNLALGSDLLWYGRALLREGVDWLTRALAVADDLPVEIVANAYTRLGTYAFETHDYAQAEPAFERAIELFASIDDQLGVAHATNGLAWSAMYEGRYQRSEDLEEQVFEIATVLGDRQLVATAHELLALLMTRRQEYDQAITRCEIALDLYRSENDRFGECHALGFLGGLALWTGDLDRAERLAKQALTTVSAAWEFNSMLGIQILGLVELERTNFSEAGALLRKCLSLSDPNQNGMAVAECLEGLAGVAVGLRDPVRGATLLGAAEVTRERFRTPIPPPRQSRYDRSLAAVKAQMSAQALETAWNLGRALSGDDAAKYALEPDSPDAHAVADRPISELTRREIDVLRLVADGLSDREIADKLFISRHTVAHHVASILNKLGVSSRTAAATYAVREHLTDRPHGKH